MGNSPPFESRRASPRPRPLSRPAAIPKPPGLGAASKQTSFFSDGCSAAAAKSHPPHYSTGEGKEGEPTGSVSRFRIQYRRWGGGEERPFPPPDSSDCVVLHRRKRTARFHLHRKGNCVDPLIREKGDPRITIPFGPQPSQGKGNKNVKEYTYGKLG